MSKVVEIKHCGDCPDRYFVGNQVRCALMKQDTTELSIPEWCPLPVWHGESKPAETTCPEENEEREPAEWSDTECPKCENGGMVARDKFGLFCVVSGCGWKKDTTPGEQQ